MPSSQQRLTLRQADAQDRRRRMTQQRQALTNRIRKQKRSEYLAKKRSLHSQAADASSSSQSGFTTNISQCTTTSPEMESIQASVKSFCTNPSPITVQALHDALQKVHLVATPDNYLVILNPPNDTMAETMLRNLEMLTSASPELLSLILAIVVRLTAIAAASGEADGYYYGITPTSWSTLLNNNEAWLSLLVRLAPQSEEACLILGNLVGEANTQAFAKLHKAGLVAGLLAAIRQPIAAWALTNAIRNDTTEWAGTYCNDQALSASLLEQVLKDPPVATQAAWMVASLTSREEQVVQYLIRRSSFMTTLIQCMQNPISRDQVAPLVQALGNIATCSPATPTETPFSDTMLTTLPTLVPMIGQLLQTPQNREVVHQAAWLAGCLLYDSGLPGHPSTEIAAPTLIPILFQELRADTPHSVDNQRELAAALWNALLQPTDGPYVPFLLTANGDPVLWENIRSSISTLVRLVQSLDPDAVLAAISVLQSILEQYDGNEKILTALEEEGALLALENVCDSPNEEASNIAANLLDYYFDMPNTDNSINDSSPNQLASPPTSGMGRGRGATLPAWMTR